MDPLINKAPPGALLLLIREDGCCSDGGGFFGRRLRASMGESSGVSLEANPPVFELIEFIMLGVSDAD